jgi:hypothetical protein
MANNILSGLLGQSSPAAYSPYAQKPSGSMLIGDALQAIGAAMMAPPTQRGLIFSQALEDAKNRRRQEQQDAMTAYRQDQQFRLAQQGQARADQEWQWKLDERKAEQEQRDKLRGVVAGAFANSSAGVPGASNYAGASSGYNPQTAAAKPYYDAGLDQQAFDILYGPRASQSAPNVQKFYDDKGQEYYAQWVNGQWQQVGGAKPQSGGITYTDAQGNTFQIGGSGKPLTESQAKDTNFAVRAEGANVTLNKYQGHLTDFGKTNLGGLPLVGNYIKGAGGPEYQMAEQAGNEFLTAFLRKDSGATITPAEEDLYGRIYLPRPGDTNEVIAQKEAARTRAIAGINAGLPPLAILEKEKALASTSSGTNEKTKQPTEEIDWSSYTDDQLRAIINGQ